MRRFSSPRVYLESQAGERTHSSRGSTKNIHANHLSGTRWSASDSPRIPAGLRVASVKSLLLTHNKGLIWNLGLGVGKTNQGRIVPKSTFFGGVSEAIPLRKLVYARTLCDQSQRRQQGCAAVAGATAMLRQLPKR